MTQSRATETDDFVIERRGAVLIGRLNRPDARNSLNGKAIQGLGAAVALAETDPDIRVLVLTGTGEQVFCAGMDLRAFTGGGLAADRDALAAFDRLCRGEVTVPLIGAANGTAVGGGLEVLLGCDLIIASTAAKFGFPEVKRGFFAAGGGIFVGSRIPTNIALELVLTGDSIDAARAYEIGLVNAVVPADEVLPTAVRYAERIAANAPLGLAASKELVRLGVSDATRAEQRLIEWKTRVFDSEDAQEGARAFAEKRAPVWRGR